MHEQAAGVIQEEPVFNPIPESWPAMAHEWWAYLQRMDPLPDDGRDPEAARYERWWLQRNLPATRCGRGGEWERRRSGGGDARV